MLRFSGNSIRFVPPPMTIYLVSAANNSLQFLDTSNNVFTNAKLLTLVSADIDAAGSVAALGSSKRYTVDGVTYAVDFTRFT